VLEKARNVLGVLEKARNVLEVLEKDGNLLGVFEKARKVLGVLEKPRNVLLVLEKAPFLSFIVFRPLPPSSGIIPPYFTYPTFFLRVFTYVYL
jgi:hypothetical protein